MHLIAQLYGKCVYARAHMQTPNTQPHVSLIQGRIHLRAKEGDKATGPQEPPGRSLLGQVGLPEVCKRVPDGDGAQFQGGCESSHRPT